MRADFNTLLLCFTLHFVLLCVYGNGAALSVMPTVQLHKGEVSCVAF